MRFKQTLFCSIFLFYQLLNVDKIIFAQEANIPIKTNTSVEIEKQITQDRKKLKFTLKSNKEIYEVGEPIYIIGIWENNTTQDVIIKKPYDTFRFDTISITDMTRPLPSYEFIYPRVCGVVVDKREVILKPGEIIQIKEDLTLSFIFKPGRYSINVFMHSNDGKTQRLIYLRIKE